VCDYSLQVSASLVWNKPIWLLDIGMMALVQLLLLYTCFMVTLVLHQTLQILWATTITRAHSNIESPIITMVKVIQMDDKSSKMDEL
jgi:hypothetical protein